MRPRAILSLVLVVLVIAGVGKSGQEQAPAASLEISGTLFRLTTSAGHVLTSPDLVGAVLEAIDETGSRVPEIVGLSEFESRYPRLLQGHCRELLALTGR